MSTLTRFIKKERSIFLLERSLTLLVDVVKKNENRTEMSLFMTQT